MCFFLSSRFHVSNHQMTISLGQLAAISILLCSATKLCQTLASSAVIQLLYCQRIAISTISKRKNRCMVENKPLFHGTAKMHIINNKAISLLHKLSASQVCMRCLPGDNQTGPGSCSGTLIVVVLVILCLCQIFMHWLVAL